MGAAKASNDRNTGPQRLIMNIKVSNWPQNVITGNMPQLPTSGLWRCCRWKTKKLWCGPERTSSAVSLCSRFRNHGEGG